MIFSAIKGIRESHMKLSEMFRNMLKYFSLCFDSNLYGEDGYFKSEQYQMTKGFHFMSSKHTKGIVDNTHLSVPKYQNSKTSYWRIWPKKGQKCINFR